jgi:SpoVK/Ycf46/Vps4 family AAA+-type ATPase
LSDDIDLPAVANRLAGYSGADIRYLCDKAAQIPFLRAVAGHDGAPITTEVIEQALSQTPRGVPPEAVRRFDAWAGT